MKLIQAHLKLIVALVGAAVVIVGRHFGETSWEYLDLTTLTAALGVYLAPNKA